MNIGLPPPPGINPPPPGKICWKLCFGSIYNLSRNINVIFFSFAVSGFGPPMFHPMSHMAPPVPPPMTMRPPGTIHYPSQDPQRMGAHAALASRHTE